MLLRRPRRGLPGSAAPAPIRAWAALLALAAVLILAVCPAGAQPMERGVRIAYAFAKHPEANCEIELTGDSVLFLAEYRFLEHGVSGSPDDSRPRRMLGARALTSGERDTAQSLFALAGRWKGYKRYVCRGTEGYAYSLWSDSLLLSCDNCYSCTEGIDMSEARALARFGKMSLWLYGLREAWNPGPAGP